MDSPAPADAERSASEPHTPTVAPAATANARGRFSAQGLDALNVPNYRFFTLSGIFQQCALNMEMLTNGWFAYQLTGSTTVLGLALLAQALPQTIFSFVGGTVSDRVPRRYLMMICFTLAACVNLWIGISAHRGVANWHDLIVRYLLLGMIMAFQMPARQGLVGELVGRERIMSAVSINQTITNVMQLSGPAIAGFTIAGAGVHGAYYVIVGLYVLGIISLLPIRYQARKAAKGAFLGSITDGLRYVRGNVNVRAVLTVSLIAFMLSMPYQALLPVFAKDVLHVGPEKLGVLASFSGVGALTAGVTLALFGMKKRGLWFVYSLLIVGVGLIGFSLSRSFALSCAIIVIVGMGQSLRNILSMALIQNYTEDAYIGRVLSVLLMQFGLSSIGAFCIALIAQQVGAPWALGGSAAILVVLAIWYLAVSRGMRALK